MIDWILGSGIGGYLLAGLIGVVSVIIAMFKGRVDGAAKEREKRLKQDAKARDVADEIDDAVAGRTATENRKRLSRWAK